MYRIKEEELTEERMKNMDILKSAQNAISAIESQRQRINHESSCQTLKIYSQTSLLHSYSFYAYVYMR